MKRKLVYAISLLLLMTGCVYADVITVDPNAQPREEVTNEQPVDDLDPRLAQKVTYQSTGQRLHTVCDELTKQTGVAIRSGSSPKDWQVRDIPVVVCVKDLPLSKILESLAAATHLALTASKDEKGVISYRIFRDMKRKAQLEEYDRQAADAAIARAKWEWDTAVEVSKIPDVQSRLNKESQYNATPYMIQKIIDSSKFIAALGNDARDRCLRGEKVSISSQGTDAHLNDLIKQIMLDSEEEQRDFNERYAASNPNVNGGEPRLSIKFSETDFQNAKIEIYMDGTPAQTHMNLNTPAFTSSSSMPGGQAYYLFDGLTTPPKYPERPQTAYPDSFAEIKYSDKPSFLQEKITLQKPDDSDKPLFSDVIVLLSKISDYSIISEDFITHFDLRSNTSKRYDIFNKEMSIKETLDHLRIDGQGWYVDKQSKTIIGSEHNWWMRHRDLVPAEYLQFIKQKMDTTGLDLDDFIPIYQYSDQQRNFWFPVSFPGYNRLEPYTLSIWQFYSSLDTKGKAMAKSDSGLPLSLLDTRYIASLFSQQNTLKDLPTGSNSTNNSSPQLPTDPDAIADLTLHVRQIDIGSFLTYRSSDGHGTTTSTESNPDGFKTHSWEMTIDGKDFSYKVGWPWFMNRFPIYSEKREKEKWDEVQKKQNIKAPTVRIESHTGKGKM